MEEHEFCRCLLAGYRHPTDEPVPVKPIVLNVEKIGQAVIEMRQGVHDLEIVRRNSGIDGVDPRLESSVMTSIFRPSCPQSTKTDRDMLWSFVVRFPTDNRGDGGAPQGECSISLTMLRI